MRRAAHTTTTATALKHTTFAFLAPHNAKFYAAQTQTLTHTCRQLLLHLACARVRIMCAQQGTTTNHRVIIPYVHVHSTAADLRQH